MRSTAGWVVICELPQRAVTIKPLAAVIFEHQQALVGHYLINPMLIIHRCDTRRQAVEYLRGIARIQGVVVITPPGEAKLNPQATSEQD